MTRSLARSLPLAGLVLLALWGCDEGPPPGVFDSGPRPDAGGRADGGGLEMDGAVERQDGAIGPDGSALPDGGRPADGGPRPDGAQPLDDAAAADGSTVADGGTATDAAIDRRDGALADGSRPTGDPCPQRDLGSATGEAVASGTLDLQGNQFVPSCATFTSGEDLGFLWAAPSAGTWAFDTLGSDIDTLIAVLDGSTCDAAELDCSDDTAEAVQSSARVTLSAGQVVVILVDEYGVLERGTFQLNIHVDVPTSESSCTDAVDEDRDGAADCDDRGDCVDHPSC